MPTYGGAPTDAERPFGTAPHAATVAEAFGLPPAAGPLRPHAYRSVRTWMLTTIAGRYLIKDVPAEWDADGALAFERRAAQAGVTMPAPVTGPVGPLVTVGGHRLRAYPWIEARALDDADDLSAWLGRTLATLHGLEPVDHPGRSSPDWYGTLPLDDWRTWARVDRAWAPILHDRLPLIEDTLVWIEAAYLAADPHCVTHRDIEPWNVLMTAEGPVLIDWDTAGTDAASLETAQAAVAFAVRGRARPDAVKVSTTLRVYAELGGRVPTAGPYVMARRIGLHLRRLYGRFDAAFPSETARTESDATLAQRLADLPDRIERIVGWGDALR